MQKQIVMLVDLVLVVVFAATGRASHSENILSGLVHTAWPFLVGLAVFGVVGAVVKVYLDYRLRMAAADAASRAARDEREAERAVARAAEAAVRAEREAALAAELAAAEAQSVLTARSEHARERVS